VVGEAATGPEALELAPIIVRRWRYDAPHAAFPSFGAFTGLSPRLGPPPPFLEQFLFLHHRPSSRLRGPELFRGEVVAARVSQRFPLDDVAIEAERRIELVRQDHAPEALREAVRGFIVGRS
jgi:hypothetical protein